MSCHNKTRIGARTLVVDEVSSLGHNENGFEHFFFIFLTNNIGPPITLVHSPVRQSIVISYSSLSILQFILTYWN